MMDAKRSCGGQGFALVATISVMVLLVMIALAMLSLSTIELRQSTSTNYQQEARANARMALMMAIGDLQKHVGPDTRVTAKASVLSSSVQHPHWVSVFKTRPDENLEQSTAISGDYVVANHEHELYLTDNREGQKPQAVAHLVSGSDEYDPGKSIPSDDSVLILDAGDSNNDVRVPLVDVAGSRYAYWVSDNSTKLLYNRSNPFSKDGNSAASSNQDDVYGSSVAQTPNLDKLQVNGIAPFAGHSAMESDELDKGLTYDTSRLLFNGLDIDGLKQAYHTVTGDSAAVFANTMNGGLKQDLTAFIENGDMSPSTDEANLNLPELTLSTPIIKGAHHNMTSPRFGVLKDWADMRFRASGGSGNVTIAPQIPENTFRQNFSRSLALKRRDLTNVDANYLQPIVVESSLGWDFSPYKQGTTEFLRTHIFPRLILWNPYNVTLEERRYVMLTNTPYYGGFHYRDTSFRIYYASLIGMSKGAHGNPGWSFPGFVTVPVTLGPGECKVFSPDMQNSKGSLVAGRGRRYDPMDFASNVLTPDSAPSSDNFFWDSNTQLTDAETTDNMNKSYGFSGNSNNFFGWYELASDEYMVLQSKSNASGSVSIQSLTSSDDYETIGHFLAQNNAEARYGKWYAAQHSQHAANGTLYFRDMSQWPADRLPPRLWRRGIRMQWYDESAESTTVSHYKSEPSRLTTPLIATTNLRGGILNHPSALGVRVQRGWQIPNLNSHLYFRQPTDPEELKSFFPPSPIGRPSDGYPTEIVLYDVPRRDIGLFSLGQFQHAQYSYLAWHPSFILGSSYSTTQSDLDATALRDNTKQQGCSSPFIVTDPARWSSSSSNWGNGTYNATNVMQSAASDSTSTNKHGDEVVIYDIAYELNHSFWDGYMLSGIPHSGSKDNRSVSWDGLTPLPVSHYLPRATETKTVDQTIQKLQSEPEYAFYHSAEFLMNHGALNVNCDSKEVWKAYLLSLQDKDHPNLASDGSGGSGNSPITRSLLPGEGGSSSISSVVEEKAWNGFRSLTESEVERLAEELVKQVKERGPYLSLADFVNRRLNEIPEQNYQGAMQAAIDQAGINTNLKQSYGGYDSDRTIEDTQQLITVVNRVDYKTAGLPGYFSQGDLLTVLAPSLTARGDTFTVRAYGEARDASGVRVMARAYCEAVVQRVPEYVDTSDQAIEPVRVYNETNHEWELNRVSGGGDEGLSGVNLRFGRQFKVTKFRWLSPAEV